MDSSLVVRGWMVDCRLGNGPDQLRYLDLSQLHVVPQILQPTPHKFSI